MRLLQFSDGEFHLTKSFVQDVPEYAILSHTWGADTEEVTFRDLVDGTGEHKTGWEKIRFCADQARRDGLSYFWVDTCCIDKSDNNELSRAINSMFRWYQNAAQCYVYLSGILASSLGGNQQRDIVQQPAFRSHTWFTRGWTLQELLAPVSVEFFTQDGHRLGDKRSLEQQIHEITGIAIPALRGELLSDFSVEERFRWAEKRLTTYEEDWAYCLLGIFGIFMPLIYGEGRAHATRRLRKEIADAANRNEKTRDPSAKSGIWMVPFERNQSFTSREPELRRLRQLLFSEHRTSKVAITGLGGVGKTQLALELLCRLRDEQPDCSIIWVPATSREALEQAYLNAAQTLGVSECEQPNVDVKGLLQSHLSSEAVGRWLLVFDNADDIGMWLDKPEGGTRRLIDYLPRSNRGSIIFTTRDKKAALALAGQNMVQLSEMDEAGSSELLQNHLVEKGVGTQEDMATLLAQLTYLPLAIVQAAAYINANGINLADYLCLLGEQEEDIIELLSEDFEDETRYHDVDNPVATTWLISFQQIRQRDPLAADYLCIMACVEPKDIPQPLLPVGSSQKKEIDAMGTLQAYSFIGKRPANSAITIHRLVHLATRNWLRSKGELPIWTHKTATRLLGLMIDVQRTNRDQWKPYVSHLHHLLESEHVSEDDDYYLSSVYGHCLMSEGRHREAAVFYNRAVRYGNKEGGADAVRILSNHANLVTAYCNSGQWEKAEELCLDIREYMETNQDVSLERKVFFLRGLGDIHWHRGRWAEAEEVYVQRFELCKERLGPDDYKTIDCILDLAWLYEELGRDEEAEKLDVQALEMSKLQLGIDHRVTLQAMARMAVWHRRKGQWEEAERLLTQTIECQNTHYGANHYETLDNIGHLARTKMCMGRREEAIEMLEGCVNSLTQVVGSDHRDTVYWVSVLAEWREAED